MAERSHIGTVVERERTRLKLSGRALAREAGIAPGNLARIERGESEPKEETIRALAKALGVSVGLLFDEKPVKASSDEGPVDGLIASFEPLRKHCPRMAGETAYVIAMLLVEQGRKAEAKAYASACVELLRSLNLETMDDMVPWLGLSMLGIPLPDLIDHTVAMKRFHIAGVEV